MAAVFCCWMTIGAQGLVGKSKMSPWLRSQYKQQQEAVRKNGGPLRVKGHPVRKYILTLVQSTDNQTTVREKGGVVLQDFGDGICAAFLPVDSLGIIEQSPDIMRMEANKMPKLMNDTSAVLIGVDKAWDFENSLTPLPSNTPQAFTGKGVFAAVMDIGFDFTHPAFRNEDGTSRIQWFWDPLAENDNPDALGQIYTTPDEVLAAEHVVNADISDHGTHVLGSMAGDGLDGRYVGMAPEADIIGVYFPLDTKSNEMTEKYKDYILQHIAEYGELFRDAIDVISSEGIVLVMLKKIFDRADEEGKPCVVNWSWGGQASFGEDSSLFELVTNRMLGPGHIVVCSSGNEGGSMSYVKKEADTPLEQDIYYMGNEDEDEFPVDIRFRPETPDFTVTLTLDDIDWPVSVNSSDMLDAWENHKYIYFASDDVFIMFEGKEFTGGYMGITVTVKTLGEYDLAHRNRYEELNLKGKIQVEEPVEIELMGVNGDTKSVLFSPKNNRNSRGCNIATIGNPGGMERLITVGAMHHRTWVTNTSGGKGTWVEYASEEGHLASFSSCGPTMAGLIKPDVVAPGHNIISALNSFTVYESQEAYDGWVGPTLAYKSNAFGKEYGMWGMSGTSMSTPVTAGVIALWLQAKPDLTPEDILGVIERTSHQPEPEFSGTDKNIYYGWGEIDAYAGLLDILGIGTSIPQLSKHQPTGVKFRLQGSTLYIDGADDGTAIRIYTTDGRLVASSSLANGCVSLPADSPAGVYAVQVGKLGSTLIRL